MPCDRQRQSVLPLSLLFPPPRTPACFNFLCFSPRARTPGCSTFSCHGIAARSLARCPYLLAGSGGSALYFFGDRRCANRQRHLVIDEGELMGENILPHLGIQEVLAG